MALWRRQPTAYFAILIPVIRGLLAVLEIENEPGRTILG
jgi:hypothetical protein